ncbi:MAG: DNA polymerase domain-containing protein [Candidatus Micrarchaeaceae archaeon]
MDNLIDLVQFNNIIYKRTSSGITKYKYTPYIYTDDVGVGLIKNNKNVKVINNNETTIDNKQVYRLYYKNVNSISEYINKYPLHFWGQSDITINLLKQNNVKYSNDPKDYRVWYWDIEVKFGKDNTPENPNQPIISIAIYDNILNKYFSISWHDEHTKNIPHKQYEVSQKLDENNVPITVIKVKDEYNLLRTFLILLRKYKPILLVGWFSNFYDMPYLIERLKINNIDPKYLSPIEYPIYMRKNDTGYSINIKGLYSLELNELITRYAPTVKFPSMNLGKVAVALGYTDKIKIDLLNDYINNYDRFIEYNIHDVRLTKQINDHFQLINILIYVHSITAISFQYILQSSKIVESALVYYADKIISVSNKEFKPYQGAIVLDPKENGILSNIVIFDANSMYPTSTITFNISPETLIASYDEINNLKYTNKEDLLNWLKDKINMELIDNNIPLTDPIQYIRDILTDNNISYIDTLYSDELNEHGYFFLSSTVKDGIYTKLLHNIYTERIKVKNKMKSYNPDSVQYQTLDVEQTALKLILNIVYGANGYKKFRLYDPRIAEVITYFARKLLLYGIQFLENKGYQIQYGDTDSLFIQLHSKTYDECKIEGNKLINELNESIYNMHTKLYVHGDIKNEYKSHLGFKLEHILRTIYFSDSKKRYYGIDYTGEHYVRGINVIRKDAPQIAKKLLQSLIVDILNGTFDYEKLESAYDQIMHATIQELGVIKSFGKDIDSYDKNEPQHVAAAKFAKEYLNIEIKTNDKPYLLYLTGSSTIKAKYPSFKNVICINDDDIELFMQKIKQDKIEIDYKHFFEIQILTPLEEFNHAKQVLSVISEFRNNIKYNNLQDRFNF